MRVAPTGRARGAATFLLCVQKEHGRRRFGCNETTLQTFVDVVLKKKLGFIDPSIEKGTTGYVDSGNPEQAVLLPRVLAELPAGGVTHGTHLEAEDFANEQIKFTIEVRHKPNKDFDEKANPERVDILTGAAAAPAVATHHDFISQNDENSEPAAKKART